MELKGEKMTKRGFTLAEILITLAIIGVVAALTIPAVVQNYQKTQTVTQLKKAYTSLNQAMAKAVVDYSNMTDWDKTDDTDTTRRAFVRKYFIPYLKVSKDCTEGDNSKCWGKSGQYGSLNLDGGNYGQALYPLILNDGTALSFSFSAENIISVYVDLNGAKLPNRVGKDVFKLYLEKGKNRISFWGNGIYYTGFTRYNFMNSTQGSGYRCKKDTGDPYSGGFCGALIQIDGWEIKDDYPW